MIGSAKKNISGAELRAVYAVVLIVSILVLVPLAVTVVTSAKNAPLFMPGVFDFSAFRVFLGSDTVKLIVDTMIFGVLSVLIGFGISIPLTWFVERTDVPGRTFWRVVIVSMMAFPPSIAAIAWTMLLAPSTGAINLFLRHVVGLQGANSLSIYSLWGMALVSGTVSLPSVFLMVGPTFRRMSRELEEAGNASGAGSWRVLQTITLPLTRPAILVAALYLFVVLIGSFEIPGIIGLRKGILVFSSRLFWAVRPAYGLPKYHVASALAMGFVTMAGVLIYIYYRAHQRVEKYATVVGRGSGARIVHLGKWKWSAFTFCSLSIFITLILPLAILVWASLQTFYLPPSLQAAKNLSLDTFRGVLSSPLLVGIIYNTLKLILVCATLTTALAFFAAWVAIRSKSAMRGFVDVVSFLPVGMPSIVVAIAVMLTYLFLPLPIYGTIWIIAIAMITKFLAYSTSMMKAALMQIHKELEEASYASGASLFTTLIRVILPLLLAPIAGSWIWVAAHSFRDLTMPTTLMSKDNMVLASYVWVLWQEGSLPQLAVVGILMFVFLLALTILWEYLNAKLATRIKMEI